MKKKVAVGMLIVTLMLTFASCSFNSANSLEIPKKTSYIITFTTGKNADEKTQISYFDKSGKLLASQKFNSKSDLQAVEYDKKKDLWQFFTSEKIYFSNGRSIENKEIKGKYKFASENGYDTVYRGDYLKKGDRFFKFIAHGLSYKLKKYGYFDLLVLYNQKQVQNMRVSCLGNLAIEDRTGNVYIMSTDQTNFNQNYEVIKYDKEKDKFIKEKKWQSLKKFYLESNNGKLPNTFKLNIGATVYHNNHIYQAVSFEEKSNSDKYILSSVIDGNTGKMKYEKAIPLNLKGENDLRNDVAYTVDKNVIKFYSEKYPNKIVKFDTKTHEINYSDFIKDPDKDVNSEYYTRIIGNKCFVLQENLLTGQFIMYQMNENDKMVKLISGIMPDAKLGGNVGIADFYVIEHK